MASSTHSLPFIVWDDKGGKYCVSDAAAHYLSSYDEKIAVVIVAGRYRSGKSFLMNQLLGDSAGFSVGHTVESHTRGIWLCSEAVEGKTESGERVKVLFMDSEGLGATDKNVQHDTTIFSLAALLCSTLIFNGSSSIDEASIQNLGFIANLTKHIQVKSHGGSADAGDDTSIEEFNRFFPSFLWVLRDFLLALVDDDGSEISPDEYMESSLLDQPGYDKETLARNRIRRCIKGFFRNRHCFTLVRPVDDEAQLQDLEHVAADTLRHEFMEGMRSLRGYVLEHARVKEIGGRVVNGPMLVQLARCYVDSINSGGIPSIADAWESAAAAQASRAAEASKELFDSIMTPGSGKDSASRVMDKHEGKALSDDGVKQAGAIASIPNLPLFPVSSTMLEKVHNEASQAALQLFARLSPGGGGHVIDKHRNALEAHFRDRYREAVAANENASAVACKALVRTLEKKLFLPCVAAASEAETAFRAKVSSLLQAIEALQAQCLAEADKDGNSAVQEANSQVDALLGKLIPLREEAAQHRAKFSTATWEAWEQFIVAYQAQALGPRAMDELVVEGGKSLQSSSLSILKIADSVEAAIDAAADAIGDLSRANLELSQSACSSLAAQLNDTQTQNGILVSELSTATATVTSLRMELDMLRDEHQSSLSALDKEKETNANMVKEVEGNRKTISSLQLANEEYQSSLRKSESEASAVAEKAAALAAELQALERSKRDISQNLTDTTAAKAKLDAEVSAARAEVETLRKSLQEVKLEKERLSGTLEGSIDDVGRHKRSIELLKEELEVTHKRCETLNQQLDETTADRHRVGASQSSLSADLATSKQQLKNLTEALASTEADLESMRTALARMSDEKDDAEQRVEELTEELHASQAQLTELSAHVATLVHDSANIAALREQDAKQFEDKIAALQIDLEAAEAVSGEMEQELAAERAAHSASTKSLAAAEAKATELQHRVEQLQGQLTEMEAFTSTASHEHNASLNNLSGEVQQLKDELSAEQQKSASLQAALDAATSAADAAASGLTAAQDELTHLQDELDEVRQHSAAVEQELATSLREREAIHQELEVRGKAHSSSTQAAGDFARKIAGLQGDLAASDARLRDMQTQRDDLAAQLDEQRKAVADADDKISALTTELAHVKAAEATYRDSLAEVEHTLADVKTRLVVAESDAEAAAHHERLGRAELESTQAKLKEASAQLDKLLQEKRDLELRNQEVGAVGRHTHASLEGLRVAKAESEKVIDRLTSELREMTASRNTALQQLQDTEIKLGDALEDLADMQRKYNDLCAVKEAMLTGLDRVRSEFEDLQHKHRELQTSKDAAASQHEKESIDLQARTTAAEEDAAAAREVRNALEKSIRASNAEIASLREQLEKLELQLAERSAEKDASLDRMDGAKNELQVIAARATQTLRQKDEMISRMKQLQRDLQMKEKRRADVDSAVELARGGAEIVKYKLVGKRVTAETRMLAVAPVTVLQALLSRSYTESVGSHDDSAAYRGDVLVWKETSKKTWTKGVLFTDISAIVLGCNSPVLEKYQQQHLQSPLDPMRCFTVIVKPAAQVHHEGAKPMLMPSGATLDFAMSSVSECTMWVYALRCLQLRAAGYGLYSLSKLTVKLERAGIRARLLAESQGMEPLVFVRKIVDEVRKKAGKTAATKARTPEVGAVGKVMLAAARAEGTPQKASAASDTKGAAETRTASDLKSSTVRSGTAERRPGATAVVSPRTTVGEQRSDVLETKTKNAVPVATPSISKTPSHDGSKVAPTVTNAAVRAAYSVPVASNSTNASGTEQRVSAEDKVRPAPARLPDSRTAEREQPLKAAPTPVASATVRSLDTKPKSTTAAGAAARAALFAGYTPKTDYKAPGSYAQTRQKEEPAQPKQEDVGNLLGVANDSDAEAEKTSSAVSREAEMSKRTSDIGASAANAVVPARSRVSRFAPEPAADSHSDTAPESPTPPSRQAAVSTAADDRASLFKKSPAQSQSTQSIKRSEFRSPVDSSSSAIDARSVSSDVDEAPKKAKLPAADDDVDELIEGVEADAKAIDSAIKDDYHWQLAQMREARAGRPSLFTAEASSKPVPAAKPASGSAEQTEAIGHSARFDEFGRPREDSDADDYDAMRAKVKLDSAEASDEEKARKQLFMAKPAQKAGVMSKLFGNKTSAAEAPHTSAPKRASASTEADDSEESTDDDDEDAGARRKNNARRTWNLRSKPSEPTVQAAGVGRTRKSKFS